MVELYYVEDDVDIGCDVKEYLERKGFKVTICKTLGQARRALEVCLPAMVLLDWNMPEGGACFEMRGMAILKI